MSCLSGEQLSGSGSSECESETEQHSAIIDVETSQSTDFTHKSNSRKRPHTKSTRKPMSEKLEWTSQSKQRDKPLPSTSQRKPPKMKKLRKRKRKQKFSKRKNSAAKYKKINKAKQQKHDYTDLKKGGNISKMKRVQCCCWKASAASCGSGRKRPSPTKEQIDMPCRKSRRLFLKNFKLPFNNLPEVCKVKVFCYLTAFERARAATVCQEWNRLFKVPSIWAHVNFSMFAPRGQRIRKGGFVPTWYLDCAKYNAYCRRVQAFVEFLRTVSPRLLTLTFAFDLAHPGDLWIMHMMALLKYAQCQQLDRATVNWIETPYRPPCADRFCCLFNKICLAIKQHLLRVRQFHRFFQELTRKAPSVTKLTLPFDWSARSVLLLCRLQHIQELHLGEYLSFRSLDQLLLDTILRSLPRLKKLEMRICQPTYRCTKQFCISHAGIEHLDISYCKGYFVKKLSLPKLKHFEVTREYWEGPLVSSNGVSCLYDVLKSGAPRLVQINRHYMQDYWKEYQYEELFQTLRQVCPCNVHKQRDH